MKIEQASIIEHLQDIDLYVCSSGFEERSTFLSLSLNNARIRKSIIFHIEDTYKISEENLSKIKSHIPDLIKITYPKNSPLATYDKFYEIFYEVKTIENRKYKVVIDITTFTREVLLILIKLLSSDYFKSFDIDIIYTPAESYANNEFEPWLTKGIREIRSVLGFSGMHSPSKDLLLILLSGFEEERAEEIIKSFEPNKIILGKASNEDSINTELCEIANLKYQHLIDNNTSILLDKFEFSCTNIKETQKQIEILLDKYGQLYNVVISPLNNKISTMGVALAGLKNENIQICYASANQYNINTYSKSSDYFLVFNLTDLIS